MEWFQVVIDSCCDSAGIGWQETAKKICSDDAIMWDRDYAVHFPSDCLTNWLRRPADYAALRAFTLAIQDNVKMPIWDTDGGGWCEADEHLLDPGVSTLWSAQSHKGVLPSLAADIGFTKEDRDALAKWQGDGSDTYSRNARTAVARVQRERSCER